MMPLRDHVACFFGFAYQIVGLGTCDFACHPGIKRKLLESAHHLFLTSKLSLRVTKNSPRRTRSLAKLVQLSLMTEGPKYVSLCCWASGWFSTNQLICICRKYHNGQNKTKALILVLLEIWLNLKRSHSQPLNLPAQHLSARRKSTTSSRKVGVAAYRTHNMTRCL